MLQFEANANAHANVDASVNGPLHVAVYSTGFKGLVTLAIYLTIAIA